MDSAQETEGGRRLGMLRRTGRFVVRSAFPTSITKQFLGKEWTSPLNVGFRKRFPLFLRLWRHGFLSDSHYIYDLKLRRGDYLSDMGRLRCRAINGAFAEILNNKLAFGAVVRKHLRCPSNLAVVVKGHVHPIDDEDASATSGENPAWLHRDVAIKPVASGSGKGVHILRWIDGRPTLDGDATDIEAVAKLLKGLDECVVTAFVEQSEYSTAFHPPTTNTIRILTMVDPDTRQPFIAIAVQRMGSSRSMPVDNWSQGGICAEIDLESGELGRGVSFPRQGVLHWHDSHPETGQPIGGVHVPDWRTIRETILAAAAKLSFLQYVGWDVVVGRDGTWVLEGNNFSDVNLLQVHRPLLADPRVRAFYRYHGIIR